MIRFLRNLLFPTRCIFCRAHLTAADDIELCGPCLAEIRFYPDGVGLISTPAQGFKPAVDAPPTHAKDAPLTGREGVAYLDGVVCVCEYQGTVRDALKRYKFNNRQGYYRTFAALLADKLKKVTTGQKFDIIVSIPLHREKEATRGYNQSLLISRYVAKHLGISEQSRALARIKKTDSQSLLDRHQRFFNMSKAFMVRDAASISGKSVLLVDDIMTTGATLNECSRVLKQAGATSVIAAVIASRNRLFG